MRRVPVEGRYVDVRAAPAAVDEQRQLILRVARRVPSADDLRHVEFLPAKLADIHYERGHHLQVLSEFLWIRSLTSGKIPNISEDTFSSERVKGILIICLKVIAAAKLCIYLSKIIYSH